jgi:uncharacterized membrane protein YbjE (DUF340 family)
VKTSLLICAFFAAGALLGWGGVVPKVLLPPEQGLGAGFYLLCLLMVFVGVGVGGSGKAFRVVRQVHWKIVFVPLAAVVGTFLGCLLVAAVLPTLTLHDSLAAGAGLGFYSMSSFIIQGPPFRNETLAAVALFANMAREIATLLLTPLFVRYFGKLAPIGTGGATTMDTTLPIITQESGKDYGMIAAFSGVVLSAVVPVLVPLIMAM